MSVEKDEIKESPGAWQLVEVATERNVRQVGMHRTFTGQKATTNPLNEHRKLSLKADVGAYVRTGGCHPVVKVSNINHPLVNITFLPSEIEEDVREERVGEISNPRGRQVWVG